MSHVLLSGGGLSIIMPDALKVIVAPGYVLFKTHEDMKASLSTPGHQKPSLS